MRIPLPENICQRLSMKAVQYAREDVVNRGWSNRSMGALTDMSRKGLVGIKTSAKYLMRQEEGFDPFLMHWVEGRTIPLDCKQGDGPHIRRGVKGVVGTPGYVTIPHRGRVWRDQRWRHPGLKPKNFMRDAILRAINEEQDSIRQELMEALKGGYRG